VLFDCSAGSRALLWALTGLVAAVAAAVLPDAGGELECSSSTRRFALFTLK
jgi:hypothetical protein